MLWIMIIIFNLFQLFLTPYFI